MELQTTDNDISDPSPILIQLLKKGLIFYFFSAVAATLICFIFGWRSIENIGNGYLYGSLALVLFAVLSFAGNTVPSQLSRLSLPTYKGPSPAHHEAENEDSQPRTEAKYFFVTMLICGAFLLVTGLFLKML
jgi:hypothetical protein